MTEPQPPSTVPVLVHGYSDVVIEQQDVFFACWVPAFDVSVAGHTQEEQLTMSGHRWWTRDELSDTEEEIWPVALLDLWADAESRRTTDRASARAESDPADGGRVEESTVPA